MLGLALKFKVTAATILLIVTSVLYLASQSQVFATAGINQTINFQGKVVNSDGTNVTDGNYDFTFRLYKLSVGGTAQWTENWTGGNQAEVTDGIFRVALGTHSSMSSLDFNDDSWYLSIEFNGDGEMDPRIRFASVPFAFNAKTVGGLSVTNTTGTLTIPNSTTISFAGAFSTVGANALTLTTTGTTGVTLPTTGTLATLAGNENLTNKTIGSTGLTFSGASLDITTATDEDLTITPNGVGNAVFNLATTGDFLVQDASTSFVQFLDDGTITLGKGSGAGTINIGTGTAADVLNIGSDNTAGDTIVIGNSNTSTTLALTGGDDWSISTAGNLTLAGATGISLSGNDADLAFSGSGNHDITGGSGTLRLGAVSLTGLVTAGNNSITGVNILDFGTNNISISGNAITTSGSNNDLTVTPNGSGSVILTSDFNTGVKIGSSSNVAAPLSVSGGIGSNAAFILDQLNNGDLIAASASGATQFRIDNTGNVYAGGYFYANQNSTGYPRLDYFADDPNLPGITFAANDAFRYDVSNDFFEFIPGGVLSARVYPSELWLMQPNHTAGGAGGNLDIYTNDTGGAADIGGSIELGGNDGVAGERGYAQISGRKENSSSGNYAGYLALNTRVNGGNNVEAIRVDSGQRVGIGNTVPTSSLYLDGKTSKGNAALIIDQTASVLNNIIAASSSGTTRFTIDNSGNIKTAAGTSLDVLAAGSLSLGNTNATSITLGNSSVTAVDLIAGTATVNIADNATTKTIDIGGVTNSGTDTINIATNATAGDTINIGNTHASTALTLTGGDDWLITATGSAHMNAWEGGGLYEDCNSNLSKLVWDSATKTFACAADVLGTASTPDSAIFTDTTPVAFADNNTTELFNDNPRPNITTDSSTAPVLVAVIIRGNASNTANDAFLAARVVFTTDGSAPSCTTSTQAGQAMIGGFTTAATHPWQVAGTFIHVPGAATNIRYTVCTSAIATGTATDTAEAVEIALTEMGNSNSNWTLENGVYKQNASTSDVLLGGITTSSAKVAFIGMNSTATPIASISATGGADVGKGVAVSGNGSIQTLNKATMTVGGSTTGDIILAPRGSVAGASVAPGADDTVDLGASSSARFRNLFLGPDSLHLQCLTADGCGQNLDYSISVNTTTNALYISANGRTGSLNQLLTINESGRIDVAGNLTIAGTTGLTFSSTGGINLAGGTLSDSTDGVDIADDLDITGNISLTGGTISDATDGVDINDDLDVSGGINVTGTSNLAFSSSGGITFTGGTISDATDEVDINDDLAISGTTGLTFTGSGADIIFTNLEQLSNDTNGTITFGRNDAGTVVLNARDDDATAALTINSGGAAALTIDTGGGAALSIGNANATSVVIGNESGSTSVEIDSGSGAINIGNGVAKAITIGNSASTTSITLSKGASGNFVLQSGGAALDCSGNLNSGALSTNSSGQIICTDDDGGAGGATAWSSIGDAAGNGAVAMGETVQTLDWVVSTNAAHDGLTVTYNNGLGTDSNTQRAFVIENANDGGGSTGTTEALLVLDNLDTNEAVTAGLVITSSGGASTSITRGLDFDDSDIVTDIEFQNNETLANDTDDEITFTGAGGSNNAGLIIDLDGATNAVPTLRAAANDLINIFDGLSIGIDGATTENISLTGFSISGGNDLYIEDQIGVNGNAYFDGTVGVVGLVGIGTTNSLSTLHVDGTTSKGNAAFILDQTANSVNDIFAASSSGITRFRITNDGTASSSAGFTIDGTGSIQSTKGQTLTLGGTSTGNTVLYSDYQKGVSVGTGVNSTQAALNVTGGIGSNALAIFNQTKSGDILSASASGTTVFTVKQDGITLGAQTDATAHNFASGCNCSLNSAAGTFGSQTTVDAATSSAVFRGKLFVATSEINGAGVYRYDGGTTWTLVTNSAGKAIAADTANIDAFVMTVYNDTLYIGSQTGLATNLGAVYSSSTADTTADSFALVNATRGTFTLANNDGISDLVVYKGALYVGTQEPNLAEVVRYDGGTTFTQVSNTTEGRIGSAALATVVDGVKFAVFQGRLFAANQTGAGGAAARVSVYSGVGTAWVDLNATAGTFGADTAIDDAIGITVYNGALYVATGDVNLANIYRWEPPGTFSVDTTVTNWKKVNNASGKVISGDTANIDAIILKTYNGRLYAGTQTSASEDTGALYEYSGVPGTWTLVNTTRGTFGAETGIHDVSVMQEYNGTFYVGGGDIAGNGSIYTWTKTLGNSYNLKFDSGSTNLGSIAFVDSNQQFTNNSNHGSFVFTHGIMTSVGAYDVAEDYPTRDEDIEPGELVSIDIYEKGFVTRTKTAYDKNAIGVYSEKPGLRLSQIDQEIDGARAIPIALMGRVPVKVSTENGAIKPGDPLTSSSIPGVAMKATKAGQVIGQAMDSYEGEEVGKITVYIDSGFAGGEGIESLVPGLTDEKALDKKQKIEALQQLVNINSTSEESVVISEISTDRLIAGLEIITPEITTQTINLEKIEAAQGSVELVLTNDGKFVINDEEGTPAITFDNKGNAFFAGTITAGKVRADQIEGMEILAGSISSLEGNIASLSDMMSSGGAILGTSTLTQETLDSLTLSGGLVVGQNATFKGESVFEKLASFVAEVVFKDKVKFEKTPEFNKDTVGFAVIKQGDKRVHVEFDKSYYYTPVITATIAINEELNPDGTRVDKEAQERAIFENNYRILISNRSAKGFDIVLNKEAVDDLPISWNAFASFNASTFQTQGVAGFSATPTPPETSIVVPQNPGAASPENTSDPDESLSPTPIQAGQSPASSEPTGVPNEANTTPAEQGQEEGGDNL